MPRRGAASGSPTMSRVSSNGDVGKEDRTSPGSPIAAPNSPEEKLEKLGDGRGLFHVIEQLAALEGALWSILDGLKSNATHVSFFCREYWGTSASHAQLSLEKLGFHERLKRQVQQACVLESLSLGVASHLCSGTMQGVSVTIRSRLRNLLYYVHENCLVLLDLVCQRWLAEQSWRSAEPYGHCPENLNLDILVRVKRYRRLRRGEHIMALRQHNEMIANVVRQLCRGATTKRVPLSSRSGDRSPNTARGFGSGSQVSVLSEVNTTLASRVPLDRLRASAIRSKMLSCIRFEALLNTDGDPDCPWPTQDPYRRYGAEHFAKDGAIIWFEPLPPMLPILDANPKLPPSKMPDAYSLVLDLDETLVHYSEHDGMGSYEIRPGMQEFIQRMHANGYELIIFTAATQDYADWVIDQIDPDRLIHHRLYRQHALPWGPIFVKDLSRMGRDLDKVLIIDNVQENFMLQPHNGIFILSWYDDPNDTALFALTPLLEELAATRPKVHDLLEKYKLEIPGWAGFESYDQMAGDLSEYDPTLDDPGYEPYMPMTGYNSQPMEAAPTQHVQQPAYHEPQDYTPAPLPRTEVTQHVLNHAHATGPAQETQVAQRGQQLASFSPPMEKPQPQGPTFSSPLAGYHPQTLPASYTAPRAAGYPVPQPQAMQAQPLPYQRLTMPGMEHAMEVKPQPIRTNIVTQAPQLVRRAPAFSGISGPFQAARPQ